MLETAADHDARLRDHLDAHGRLALAAEMGRPTSSHGGSTRG